MKENSNMLKKAFSNIKTRLNKFLKRRPHRTFKLTRRRDYVRSLNLPGYFSFTNYVIKTLWKYKKILGLLIVIYAVMTLLMVGLASQDVYSTLRATINATGSGLFDGVMGELGKSGILFLAAATGGISQNLSESQQIYSAIIALMGWLSSVWLLRNLMAGHKVKLRDGLYSSGAPILSTFIVALVLLVQLLPIALAFIGISAAAGAGILNVGVQSMMFWIAAILLGILSLYWITSTLFALIIVTIPGMYPFTAIKAAGDIVLGRRLRILYRFLWMGFVVVFFWALTMIPIIILDSWIKSIWPVIDWLPVVPVILLALSSLTIVFVSGYVYLLYRKVVDDDSEPA